MKTSLAIAIVFVLTGASLMLLRREPAASPPAASAPPGGVASVIRRDRMLPTTSPAQIADAPADLMPNSWSLPPGNGRRSAATAANKTTSALSAIPNPMVDAAELSPMAREALAYVGTDVEANDFWAAAINDSDVSANDRLNLIEDLNEAGFSDPQHLTSNDLPLIQSRLALIETLAPDAMDDVNAAAFDEAYNDLSKMRDELQPQASTERGVQFNVR